MLPLKLWQCLYVDAAALDVALIVCIQHDKNNFSTKRNYLCLTMYCCCWKSFFSINSWIQTTTSAPECRVSATDFNIWTLCALKSMVRVSDTERCDGGSYRGNNERFGIRKAAAVSAWSKRNIVFLQTRIQLNSRLAL